MAKRKRHLRVSQFSTRTACGLKDAQHWSFHPAEVTCLGCSKTLAMADMEVLDRQRHNTPHGVNHRKGK